MKKFFKILGISAMLAMMFNFAACGGDDDDGSNDGEEVTLKIEENTTGFVSTGGSIKTNDTSWIGFTGEG